ncbi:hypothetical protein QBC38DRAFT_368848 [Podospora fimiseda]|uniref:Uncharacterized protein n=1 Tax=Podospora fimiseda TaxID=252190 RepID=A0AAN7BL98_9PEZI|nr:hypothetical protein QBC38DRAFT_368848 [Podospora fimiseda]
MDGSSTGTITELDLNACHSNSIVDRINSMPALKTSTAFFTFLRANLVLPHSAMSSNVSTPNLGPAQTLGRARSASPSPLAANAPLTTDVDDDDDIPPLSLEVLTEKLDKVAALKLVADSIAQQRQQAAYNAIFHPLPFTCLIAILGAVYRYSPRFTPQYGDRDIGTTLMLIGGVVMAYLVGIRSFTSGYLRAAEAINWDWLQQSESGEEDVIIGTRFGRDIIGATVLRIERPRPGSADSGGAKRHRARGSLSSFKGPGGKGVIRAWTVRLRYRRRGVGGDMLREAVRITRERCGKDAEVGFAKEHANSAMVLPEMFNKSFRKDEMRAARALEHAVADVASNGRKR